MSALTILRSLEACDEATEWVEAHDASMYQLWRSCPRGDWLVWLLTRASVLPHLPDSDRRLRLIACDIAVGVLPLFERERPGDTRPRDAIATARRYAEGEATASELTAAWAAAWAARDVAWAAAWAAACDASNAAAWAAARDAAWAEHARIIRRHYSWREVRTALEAAGVA